MIKTMKPKVHMMQQDPLNLRSLPQLSPPSDDWPAIAAALREDRNKRNVRRTGGALLAIAASLAITAGLILQRPTGLPVDQDGISLPAIAQAGQQTSKQAGGNPVLSNSTDSLIALSQRLETNLRQIRSDIGALPTTSLIYQVELEDMVAQLDEELSMNPDSTELWSQRVRLLLDLSQLYKNELRRESLLMASV